MLEYQKIESIALSNPGFNDVIVFDEKNEFSFLERYGLLFNVGYPQIGKAEADTRLVYVPGSGRLLNLTGALDGRVHYKQRTIVMQFTSLRPADQWHPLLKQLENDLQGQWLWFRFRNSSFYWRGFFRVTMEKKQHRAVYTVSVTANPYSYNVTAWLGNDWLWDIFNFETDTIYTTRTEVKQL